jgi:hypothetical protein
LGTFISSLEKIFSGSVHKQHDRVIIAAINLMTNILRLDPASNYLVENLLSSPSFSDLSTTMTAETSVKSGYLCLQETLTIVQKQSIVILKLIFSHYIPHRSAIIQDLLSIFLQVII